MNLWALLKDGKIVNTVTTNSCRRHMQEHHPDFEVQSFWSLPESVREAYEFYRERP